MNWVSLTLSLCYTWTVIETLTGRICTYCCINGVCTVTCIGG